MAYNIADLFEHTVDVLPDRIALIDGESRLTYKELDDRANAMGHHLAACGVVKDDHVGIYAQNSHEWLEAMLGCLKIRAVPVNVNYRYVEDELSYLIGNAELVACVFDQEYAGRLSAVADRSPKLKTFVHIEDNSGADVAALGSVGFSDAIAAQSTERDFAERSADDIYVIYTGGTTGMPKGVGIGDMVLIHAENCPEGVIAWYACARVGAIAVTTNTRSVRSEVSYFIEQTSCVGAITQPKFAALVAEAGPELGWIVVTDDNSGLAASSEELAHGQESFSVLEGDAAAAPVRTADPMLPAGVLFTSGTTSKPKAVVHTHANMLWAGKVNPTNIDMGADDIYLASLPFFHVNTQAWAIWTVLGVGGTVVLQPKFSASRFWDVIAKHSVTHISLIPFVIKAAFDSGIPENHTVKVGVFGLIMPVLDQMMGMRVIAAYGMTELVTHCIHSNDFESYPDLAMGKKEGKR